MPISVRMVARNPASSSAGSVAPFGENLGQRRVHAEQVPYGSDEVLKITPSPTKATDPGPRPRLILIANASGVRAVPRAGPGRRDQTPAEIPRHLPGEPDGDRIPLRTQVPTAAATSGSVAGRVSVIQPSGLAQAVHLGALTECRKPRTNSNPSTATAIDGRCAHQEAIQAVTAATTPANIKPVTVNRRTAAATTPMHRRTAR